MLRLHKPELGCLELDLDQRVALALLKILDAELDFLHLELLRLELKLDLASDQTSVRLPKLAMLAIHLRALAPPAEEVLRALEDPPLSRGLVRRRISGRGVPLLANRRWCEDFLKWR